MALAIALLVQNGLSNVPNIRDQMEVAQSFRTNRLAGQDTEYLLSSYLQPLAGRAFGAVWDWRVYFVFCLAVSAALWAGLFVFFRRLFGSGTSAAVVLASTQFSTIAMQWVGMPDSLVVVLATAALVTASTPVVFVVAFLLPVAHREQGLALLPIVACGRWVLANGSFSAQRRQIGALVIGTIAGAASLSLFLRTLRPAIKLGREDFYSFRSLRGYLSGFVTHPFVSFYTVFGLTWLVVVYLLWMLWGENRQLAVAVGGMIVVAFSLAAVTLDFSRVASILSFPALVTLLAFTSNRHLGLFRRTQSRWLPLLLMLVLVCPRIVMWEGRIHSSLFVSDLHFVKNLVTTDRSEARSDAP